MTSYADRLHKTILEAYGRIVARHMGCKLEIKNAVGPWGNYNVNVSDGNYLSGYLFPDMTVRGLCFFNRGYHGFYQTRDEAQAAVDAFQRNLQSMSTDPQLRGIIDNALQTFVNEGKMFTAFDVTAKVRNDNAKAGIHVYHDVVKNYVHGQFEGGLMGPGYDRVTIPVGNPPPWLYYVPGLHDPNQYMKSTAQQSATAPVSPPLRAVQRPKVIQGATAPVSATFGGIRRG